MQKIYSTLIIIFTAFLSSSFVYLMIGFFLKKSHQQGLAPGLETPLFYGLLAVAFANVVAAQVIQRRSFDEGAPRFDSQEKLRAFITTRHIVMFALSEVPAILGLVYFLMSGIFLRLLLFVGLSVASFLLVKPSLSALEDFESRNNRTG